MSDERVLTVLAQVAEQLGFLSALGPAPDAAPDAASVVLALTYTGPVGGTVTLAATPGLAEGLARNLLALDPGAPVPADDAREALAELLNVSAGNLLPALHGDGEYRLEPPRPGVWPAAAVAAAGLECAEGVVFVAVA